MELFVAMPPLCLSAHSTPLSCLVAHSLPWLQFWPHVFVYACPEICCSLSGLAVCCHLFISYLFYVSWLSPALPYPLSCPLPPPCPALVCLWYVPFVGKMFYLCRLCLRFVHSFLSFCLIDFLGNWCFFFLCSTLILTLCS